MNLIKAAKTVTINKSAEELYRFWHNFENLPHFMKHLQSVKVSTPQRSHWTTSGPLGTQAEWDADITEDRENELIAWTSTPGSEVENSGFIHFKPLSYHRGTAVRVGIKYNLATGAVGDAMLKLFGESPEQQIGDDLRRFKMLMETGEIATTEGQPTGHH